MYGPKNKGGALMALAAAGGLWAWQNRDKLKGMITQYTQSSQFSPQGQLSAGGSSNPPAMTGETRRISPEELDRLTSDTSSPDKNV